MEIYLKYIEILIKRNKSKRNKKRYRSCAVRVLNRNRKRCGFYFVTFRRMKDLDAEWFFIHTRMSVPVFNALVNMLTPFLRKISIRESVSPEERLAITLL